MCGAANALEAPDRTDLEKPVCPLEVRAIEMFKEAIHHPKARVNWNEVGRSQFSSVDGRRINGLVWRAANPRGYLLIAQGTSMIAAEIYDTFADYRSLGLDVYIYDFRGYGLSTEGNTSLNALISDYRKRVSELNSDSRYRFRFLYGLSVGGLLFVNALAAGDLQYTAMVLDSVPNAIPFYLFCPKELDPEQILPKDCSNWLVIGGGEDRVIGSRAASLARTAEKECGAQALARDDFGHIFMDGDTNTRARLNAAADFFRSKMDPKTP